MTPSTAKDPGLGIVHPQLFTFGHPGHEMVFVSGQKWGPVTLAYEAYGRLNAEKSNAVLVLHALSGDAHAAGHHPGETKPGWWDPLIGPGRALDTDRYFVLCSNVIGGCRGSSGPSSLNPHTGQPYGIDFPMVTIADMVEAQRHLIDHLGIQKLLCVVGGSMGGMQALQWVARYPERVKSCVPIATTLKHSPQQIAFNEVARQAIMADPAWQGGHYYAQGQPERGLALARMIGHITYMSEQSMEEKFSRRRKDDGARFSFHPEFEVEGYLHHRGTSFVQRFDANSYLYVTKAIDYFDVSDGKLLPPTVATPPAFLVMAFQSDWLYPPHQARELMTYLKARQADATYCEIESTYGHDAFLVEYEEETRLLKGFLTRISQA